jgi:predicted ArsR family transcriptional regulator
MIEAGIKKALEEGDKTRSELCEMLDIPRTTLYNYLFKLERDGKVRRYLKGNGERGRPKVIWSKVSFLEKWGFK